MELPSRQLQVMQKLWITANGLSASEIVDEELKINTVQACLRSLLKKGYVKVSNIGYSGKVLARRYAAVISEEQYYGQILPYSKKMMFVIQFVSGMEEPEQINELYSLIKNKRDLINEKNKRKENVKKNPL